MMLHQFVLKYIFIILFCTNAINSSKCSRKMQLDTGTGGKTVYYTAYFCCKNSLEYDGNCKACRKGTIPNKDRTQCLQCEDGFYGQFCAETCDCNTEQRCDNVIGCVSVNDNSRTSEQTNKLESTNVKRSQPDSEGHTNLGLIIYMSCLAALGVLIVAVLVIWKNRHTVGKNVFTQRVKYPCLKKEPVTNNKNKKVKCQNPDALYYEIKEQYMIKDFEDL